jgi:MFS family permease
MRKEYKVLLAISLLVNIGDNLIGPFYAIYIQKVGIGLADLGYAGVIFNATIGLLMIAIGKLSDKLNKELITVAGYYLFALGTLGYMIISRSWHLFLLQVIFALAAACLSAPLTALFAKYIDKKEEGLEWGLNSGGQRIAVAMAVLAGTLIVTKLGFTTLFITMFCVQITAAACQTWFFLSGRKAVPAEAAGEKG